MELKEALNILSNAQLHLINSNSDGPGYIQACSILNTAKLDVKRRVDQTGWRL